MESNQENVEFSGLDGVLEGNPEMCDSVKFIVISTIESHDTEEPEDENVRGNIPNTEEMQHDTNVTSQYLLVSSEDEQGNNDELLKNTDIRYEGDGVCTIEDIDMAQEFDNTRRCVESESNVKTSTANNGIHHRIDVDGCNIQFEINIKGMVVTEADSSIKYNISISMSKALVLLDMLGYQNDELEEIVYKNAVLPILENHDNQPSPLKHKPTKARRKYTKKEPSMLPNDSKRKTGISSHKVKKEHHRKDESEESQVEEYGQNDARPDIPGPTKLEALSDEEEATTSHVDIPSPTKKTLLKRQCKTTKGPTRPPKAQPPKPTTQPAKKLKLPDHSKVCDVCGKDIVTGTLAQHRKIHEERRFLCTICPGKFVTKGSLAAHIRTHSDAKPHMCSVCGRCFGTPNLLKLHTKIHTGERPYACSYCGVNFRASSNLVCHIRHKHTGDRPHKCSWCPSSFVSTTAKKEHERKHTGEKPYSCDECSFQCARSGGMSVHKKQHLLETPYKCSYCNRSFRILAKVRRHELTHSDSKPFSCVFCSYTARRNDNLKAHINRHHTDNE